MRLTGAGVIVGLFGATFATRLLSGLLYGTPRNDPLVYVAVSVTVIVVALVASYVPAWRAARVDPTIALRGM
jgi:ABC-type antimicrobial peptide transport system permease subunit